MNQILSALILALIQGIAEWLPISSSGHLVLFSRLLGFSNSLTFDVALHFGTLMAVFVYFGKDIIDIIEDLLKGNWKTENSRLGFLLIIGTIPAGIAGFLFHDIFENTLGNLWLLCLGFATTGVILLIGSININKSGKNAKKLSELSYKSALLIGLAEMLSLFRGISRGGTTISSGLLLGLREKSAVKFSFLLSIPVVFGANVLEIGNATLPPEMLWAALVSFAAGLLTIHISFTYILNNRKNLRWLALYVFLIAAAVLVYLI